MLRLAFFQPDIAANFGAGLRLAACLGLDVDVIEPAGFPIDDKRLRRAAMDYGPVPAVVRHTSFAAYLRKQADERRRTVLLSTKGAEWHHRFVFQPGDSLMAGRESSGVPPEVHAQADAVVKIAMAPDMRSFNVINALAMAASEAMRQQGGFEKLIKGGS